MIPRRVYVIEPKLYLLTGDDERFPVWFGPLTASMAREALGQTFQSLYRAAWAEDPPGPWFDVCREAVAGWNSMQDEDERSRIDPTADWEWFGFAFAARSDQINVEASFQDVSECKVRIAANALDTEARKAATAAYEILGAIVRGPERESPK